MENEYIEHIKRSSKTTKKKSSVKEKKKNMLVRVLSGEFLVKDFVMENFSFIVFIMFLLLLIIAKGYYGEQLMKNVAKTQQELEEVTSDYFEAKTRLEEQTKRLNLLKLLEEKGLKETTNPAKVIRVEKKVTKDGK